MSDPAAEAARKAMAHDPHQGVSLYDIAEIRVNAAREALKPIRELYEQLWVLASTGTDPARYGERYVLTALAPLIYTTEELEDR